MRDKPNLLFIIAGEFRHDSLTIAGNDRLRTPCLDELASSSAVFRRAYCSQPVSPTSRGSIMTGLYPHTSGVTAHKIPLAADIPTLVELMGDPEYATAYMGLWVLGREIDRQHGFDTWVSIEDGYRNNPGEPDCLGRQSSYGEFLKDNGYLHDEVGRGLPKYSRFFSTRLPEAMSKPAFLSQQASDFIAENREQPFVLYVSFLEPHPPNASVNDNLYEPNQVILPPAFGAKPSRDIPLRSFYNRKFHSEHIADRHGCFAEVLTDERAWRRLIARYWGQITLVDRHVGKILDRLSEADLDRDTVVVFTSDHCDMMGELGMLRKSVQYESAVRVPLLIRMPGARHLVVDEAVSQVDLVPTLLESLGRRTKADLDGVSLMPVIRAEEHLFEDVVVEWNEPDGAAKQFALYRGGEHEDRFDKVVAAAARSLMTQEGWKLSLSEAGEHELYDLKSDPFETDNLYFKNKAGKKIAELTDRLLQWQRRTGDRVSFPSM